MAKTKKQIKEALDIVEKMRRQVTRRRRNEAAASQKMRTSSLGFEASGRTNDTLLYFSGSGNIGLNTNDPQAGFDVLSEEVQFQRPGARKGLKIDS